MNWLTDLTGPVRTGSLIFPILADLTSTLKANSLKEMIGSVWDPVLG